MSNSELKQQIQEAMKTAMRDKAKDRLTAIRLILAAIKQVEVDERIELDDKRVLAVLDKLCKQTKDSISQYQAANRDDLVQKEQTELEVYQSFMPSQLTSEEITKLVQEHVNAVGATGMQDMGKVMASLKPVIQGRADGATVSLEVKKILSAASA